MVDSSKMSLEEPYKIRLQNAAEWSLQNPKESVTAAARIYHVKDNSVRVKLQRMAHQKKHVGGQNRVLSDEQSAAVLQYMRDKLNEGLEEAGRFRQQ
jgi:ABC-type nitrate/sulfonate/bicarbonate transport system substrate-binding protein